MKDSDEAFFLHKQPYLHLYHDQLPHLFNPECIALHQMRQVTSRRRQSNALLLTGRAEEGRLVALCPGFLSDVVFRLQVIPGVAVPEHTIPCVVEAEWPAPPLQVEAINAVYLSF